MVDQCRLLLDDLEEFVVARRESSEVQHGVRSCKVGERSGEIQPSAKPSSNSKAGIGNGAPPSACAGHSSEAEDAA